MRALLTIGSLCAALLLSTACPYVGSREYSDDIRDFDGDGVLAERFGGDDCRDNDASVLRCDNDGDGFRDARYDGDDCDDADASVHPGAPERCNDVDDDCDGLYDDADPDPKEGVPTWHSDADNDGFGDPDATVSLCIRPSGYTADARDCDDRRDDVHPGAPEFCDDIDRDCTGNARDAVDQLDFYPDLDGDGFGRPLLAGEEVVKSCGELPGLAPNKLDCDDTDATAFPGAGDSWYDGVDSNCDGANDYDQDGDGQSSIAGGGLDCDDTDPAIKRGAVEVCDNGIDNDCDGLADDLDHNEDPVDPTGQLSYFLDADGDSYGGTQQRFCVDKAPSGWILRGGDCDDQRADILPGAVEVCDNTDNDCDGIVDDHAVDAVDYFADGDGDGFGSVRVRACDLGPGLASVDGDCNDADPQTWPGAPELCGDAFRQDCSTLSVDDCDSDGFEDVAAGGTDCDDTRDDVFPGGTEVCDGHDNDCDGDLDGDDADITTADLKTWYVDDDGDGFGTDDEPAVLVGACSPPPGTSDNTDDCDDADAAVYPGALERCDGVANDCDAPGLVDVNPVLDVPSFHLDSDGDGFGNPAVVSAVACEAPSTGTWTLDESDCNDGDAAISPAAVELCDGVDNDCDGLLDASDDNVQPPLWFADNDADGWGVATDAVAGCTQPVGYVSRTGDCNDFDDTTNPAAPEICDSGADNDCDGLIDDADPNIASPVSWYRDADLDGFGDPADERQQCEQPVGYVGNTQDCDDTDLAISPGSIETCDSIDNDCDGLIDDADNSLANALLWYADTDSDGWGSFDSEARACTRPDGHLPQGGDCDDATDTVYPGAPEICDGLDNDCDGDVDDADTPIQGTVYYVDGDGDGHGDPGASTESCTHPGTGWSADPDDCLDTDPNVHPGAAEVCNTGDDDCDGLTDDQDPSVEGTSTFWIDVDGDGHGNPNYPLQRCQLPNGYAGNNTDCSDIHAQSFPGNFEVCDGIDNDCDGLDDDSDPDLDGSRQLFFADSDGDTWGDDNDTVEACIEPEGYTPQGGDCDDTEFAVAPNRPEICGDGLDNDCSGLEDDGATVWLWPDGDMDGWGDVNASQIQACPGPGFSSLNGDCDDTEPSAYPGASEVWYDGIDQDCNYDDDYDQDHDGFRSDEYGGLDCDDTNASVQFDCVDGTGADGLYTAATLGSVVNVYAAVTAPVAFQATSVSVNDPSGFAVGDEILILQVQGGNAGRHAFAHVASIAGNTLFTVEGINEAFFQSGSDTAQVVRVPQFTVVEVPAGTSIVPLDWDGSTGGVVAFRAAELNVTGAIDASGSGFAGIPASGTNSVYGQQGAGMFVGGGLSSNPNAQGGGGGERNACDTLWAGAGGGGGHATAGLNGQAAAGAPCQQGGQGGFAVGQPQQFDWHFGGSGGQGGSDEDGLGGGSGGGGGVVFLGIGDLTVTGAVRSDGLDGLPQIRFAGCGAGGGGGGAGGAIVLEVANGALGTGLVTAVGGGGGQNTNPGACGPAGGAGADGRITIRATSNLTGTSAPPYAVAP